MSSTLDVGCPALGRLRLVVAECRVLRTVVILAHPLQDAGLVGVVIVVLLCLVALEFLSDETRAHLLQLVLQETLDNRL